MSFSLCKNAHQMNKSYKFLYDTFLDLKFCFQNIRVKKIRKKEIFFFPSLTQTKMRRIQKIGVNSVMYKCLMALWLYGNKISNSQLVNHRDWTYFGDNVFLAWNMFLQWVVLKKIVTEKWPKKLFYIVFTI